MTFEWVSIGRVAEVFPSNVDKIIDPEETPVRLCNYVDVYKNDRITGAIEFKVGSANAREIARFRLRVGDVLVTKDSEDPFDIAVPALVDYEADDLVCGYHLAVIRPGGGAYGAFMRYALLSAPVRGATSIEALGITRFGLKVGSLKRLTIPLPDLPTQKAIAAFLDRETARIDQLIEKKQRLVELLSDRRGAEQALLLGGRSAADEAPLPDAPWLRPLPDGWNIRRLRSLVRISTGSRDTQDADPEGRYPFYVRSPIVRQIDTYSYDEEAVLTSGDGAGVGSVFHLVDGKFELHQRMYAFTKFKGVDPRFFYFQLRAFFRHQMQRWSAKSTVDSVRMPFLKSMPLALPSMTEQVRIVSALTDREAGQTEIIEKTEGSIDRLKEYRSALITAAVTGQIDVETWSRRGEGDRRLDRIEEEMAG